MKVLVIEDSERLRRSLEHGLRRSGFAVDLVGDGREGLSYARVGSYDAVVLDLMLPGLDGLSVLRSLREEGNKVHVLILSARDQVQERIEGLKFGADDYLTKPFVFEELVARLQALIRRKFGAKDPIHRIGSVEIDTGRRTVRNGTGEIELTRNEYAILEVLLSRRGRVVSKLDLLDKLYAEAGRGSENAVEVFVHQLRKKLHKDGQLPLITTRRGHGYLIE